ncbi:UNVERIFIED_CONTAM: hypothetical protein FKN15_019856 [Acipenser sinensis]
MDSPRIPPALFTVLLFVSLQTLGCAKQDCSRPTGRSFNVNKCNGTAVLEESAKEHLKGPSSWLLIPSLYLVVIFIGLPANMLALWVLIAKTKKMPSTSFLINLSVADLLLILVLPFKIFYHFSGNDWVFGEILCRLMTTFFYGNMYCSILCLMFISIDRYIALVHPFSAKTLRSKKMASYLCVGVWFLVIGAMLPLGLTQQSYSFKEPNITTCHDALPKEEQANFFFPYFASLFAVGFVAPFCLIVFCNCAVLRALILSEKRYVHAAKITALVLLVFVVCFAPSNIILILHYSEFQMSAFLSLTPQSHLEETEFEPAHEPKSLIVIVGAVVSMVIIVTLILGMCFVFRKKNRNMSSGDKSSSRPVRALKNGRRSIWKGWPDSSFPGSGSGSAWKEARLCCGTGMIDRRLKAPPELSHWASTYRSTSALIVTTSVCVHASPSRLHAPKTGVCVKLFYVKPFNYRGNVKKGDKIGNLLPMQKVYSGITSHIHVQMCDKSDPTPYL